MSARSWARADANNHNHTSVPEPLRLACWRLAQLLDAGYEAAEAFALATDPSVDLHTATDLVRHGCSHETAVRILR
jgi:hypothetical protein